MTILQVARKGRNWNKVDENVNPEPVEHPRGFYPARVDEKGRLKLPADFQRYLMQSSAEKVFITSFDESIGRIYPISTWKEIERTFNGGGEEAEAAEDLWFTANHLGRDSEMDGQGRLPIPPELRRALSLDNAQVHLQHYKGHIRIFTEEVYAQRLERARQNRREKLNIFEKKGLQ